MDKNVTMITSRSQLGELLVKFGLPKKVVELGVAEGRYSREMMAWGLDELHLVDLWETMPFISGCASFEQKWHDENYMQVLQLQSEYPDKIFVHKGFSHKIANLMPNETFGLIYVDADHTYEGCQSDIKSWWPKLVSGGVMAYHDFGLQVYGVNRAVTEFASANNLDIHELPENGALENKGAWIRKP